MAGFEAAAEVDPLNYNFTPYLDRTGTIPEPSGDAVTAFRRAVLLALQSSDVKDVQEAALTQQTQVDAGGTPDTMALLSKAVDAGLSVEIVVSKAVVDLAGGEITAADLDALPYRPRQAFLGWVTGAFLSPEA